MNSDWTISLSVVEADGTFDLSHIAIQKCTAPRKESEASRAYSMRSKVAQEKLRGNPKVKSKCMNWVDVKTAFGYEGKIEEDYVGTTFFPNPSNL